MHAKEFASVVNTMHISTEKGNPIGAHPIWKEKKDSNLLGKIGHHTGVWPKLAVSNMSLTYQEERGAS